jgi:hypothetical protein
MMTVDCLSVSWAVSSIGSRSGRKDVRLDIPDSWGSGTTSKVRLQVYREFSGRPEMDCLANPVQLP